MFLEKTILLIFSLRLIQLFTAIPTTSYHLLDINTNTSVDYDYCSNSLSDEGVYEIPRQCHQHLRCDSYHCDDQSFRCVKLRETLCCLYVHLEKTCREATFKESFRTFYFHLSIQHGYCEINLERIEQVDRSYCMTEQFYLSTTTLHLHEEKRSLSSTASCIGANVIVLFLLSILI